MMTTPVATGLRFIDLFAGIGGFSWALSRQLGAECVFASEWDKFAQQTYKANFEEHDLHGDITAIAPSSIPRHDILTAGFPCQPFSIAGVSKANALGRAHGFAHPTQGTLFFNVKEIIAEKRPRAFVLENVKNLHSHDGGNTFRVIKATLDELGYTIDWRIIDARHWVPQHRERIFIVGFKDKGASKHFRWPELPTEKPVMSSVLESKVEPKYTLSDALWRYLQGYAEKHRAAGNGFGFGLVDANSVSRTLSARYYKDGSEILVKQQRKNPRRLTPKECARLMGFPPEMKIVCSDTRAYRQFGNSVAVPVVRDVCAQVASALRAQDAAKLSIPKGSSHVQAAKLVA